ncbi:MAG: thiamine-phosphate kinase [Methylotenera sp.]
MHNEFNLIEKYFTRPAPRADLGVGDDAALVRVAEGNQLVISTDMSVAGTHFFADAAPFDIGWKALAVNVSDIAAMGAQPKWATLAIALPDINESWLAEFSRGFFACADEFGIDLIGGDTTKGPLNISVTIMGEVPIGKALKRSGAQVGDDIWVSGQLGSAALGLAHLHRKITLKKDVLQASIHGLCRPAPRANLGLKLREIATSCIDISDGLLADLGHILKTSNCGAMIDLEKVPCVDFLKNDLENPQFQEFLLAGGDDYELCFTAPPSKREAINLLSKHENVLLTCIASTRMDIGLQAMFKNKKITLLKQGFDHFG